ncbi:MAG: hypothetical protein IPQ09_26875 [Myxococcales bacterium]|nr:hypothetical protein [Myxococcales bacterium]HQY60224.1 hypothetical protein [Polyangiaceae bacterium]
MQGNGGYGGPPGAPPGGGGGGYGPPPGGGGGAYGPPPGGGGPPPGGGGYGPPPGGAGGPPGAYGPPPPQQQQQQQQQGAYGAPPGAMVQANPYGVQGAQGAGMAQGGGGTVMGIPLEPGERVIWFQRHDYTVDKVILWIFGVLFLIMLIGIIFIILAIIHDGRNPRAHVITNRRVIVIDGKGQPQSYALDQIADLEPVRQSAGGGGGGLIGLAVRAAVTAVANHMANQNAKVDPNYWNRTIAVTLTTHHGQRVQVPAALKYGKMFGATLARVVFMREAESMPQVQFLP